MGKARADERSAAVTCAGVKELRCETISAATAATRGDEKLVPTETSKLLVQLEANGPCEPLLVAARIGYRQGEPAVMLMQLPPGAEMVISGPMSEKPTLVPAWRKASTPITPRQLAGWLTGWPVLLPAEATMVTPTAVISSTAA